MASQWALYTVQLREIRPRRAILEVIDEESRGRVDSIA